MGTQQAQQPPITQGRKWFSRRTLLVVTFVTGAAFIATAWILSSLGVIPSKWATILPILVTVSGVAVTFWPLVFLADKPETATTTDVPTTLPVPPPTSKTTYPGIVGLPPPTDPKTIQQREKAVQQVYNKLTQPNITAVVLTGIGGVGKSTLAALVYNYAEEQRRTGEDLFTVEPLWLRVDPAVTMADLTGNLVEALGKPLPDLSSLSPENQAVALFNALNSVDKPRLVILDQFENLLDWQTGHARPDRPGIGEWLDALNSQKCTCRVLLTSRPFPQGTRDYPPTLLQEYAVGGLEETEAIDLLRKQGVKGTDAELRIAIERCAGHALSLTLLASLMRKRNLSMTTLLKDPTYSQLWSGNIARNLLESIYTQQLDELHRKLLQAFSVYREPVPLEAALAIINTSTQIPRVQLEAALDALLAQHLLQASGEGRFQLHVIVATYVQDHFVEGDEQANRQAVQEAHAQAARFYVQQAETRCPPREQRRRVSEVQPFIEAVWHQTQAGQWQEAYGVVEREGLFASLSQWGGNVQLLELAQLLLPRGNWQPGRSQEATIYLYLGEASEIMGKKTEALDYYQQALGIYREVRDRGGEVTTLLYLGRFYHILGKQQEALDYYQQALGIYREMGDRHGEGMALNNMGRAYHRLDKQPEALDYLQQALTISRAVSDRDGEGWALNDLGDVYDSLDKRPKALDYYQQALTILREVDDRRGEGVTLGNLGNVYDSLGKQPEALDYYQQALTIFREMGDRDNEVLILGGLGLVYYSLGKRPEALDYFQQALTISREVGDRHGEGVTLFKIGARLLQQDVSLAAFLLALITRRRHRSWARKQDVSLAALLLARQLFEDVQSHYQNDVQSLIDTLRDMVGEKQFTALVAQVEPHAQQVLEQFLKQKQG